MSEIQVLTLEIGGKTFTYAAPVGDRDPMGMTLGEWRSAPLLTADALLDRFVSRPLTNALRQGRKEAGE